MMKLIVNGDDFGYSKGQNLGVLECFQDGIVSSTSLMVNMPGFEHAIELMKKYDFLKVGLHFVLTVGKSLAGVSELTDENGYFERDFNKIDHASLEAIEKEYRAQLQKFLDTGFIPNHLDYHVYSNEKQFQVILKLAKEYNIPIRADSKEHEEIAEKNNVKCSKNLIEDFYNNVKLEKLIEIIESNKDKDLIEIACHPAYVDANILKNSSYNIQRAYEKEILTSNAIKTFLKNNDYIEIISYEDL